MNPDPKVSVIIPVYKVEPFLRQCLDSVTNQTYRNLEIILIDDGSPDNCGRICDEYAEKDSRIIVIHKENGGLSAARNDGIQLATGEWIAFVDSDDWLDVDFYKKMIEAVKDTEADIACSQGHIIEFPQKSVAMYAFEEPLQIEKNEEKPFLYIKTIVPKRSENCAISAGTVWDKLFRTSFLKSENLLFDTSSKAWEDLWFSLQAYTRARRVVTTMIMGYHYRMVPNSITKSFNPNRPQINYDFISKVHSLGLEQDRAVKNAVEARGIGLILHSLRLYFFHPANTETRKDTAIRIKEMKRRPYFHEAIWSQSNQYLTKKQIVLKYVLRLPWVWPLKLIYDANEKLKMNGQ